MSGAVAMIVGTAETCDLRVRDDYASAEHARIVRRADGTTWVTDLGSANGTWLELITPFDPSVFGGLSRRGNMHLRDRITAERRWYPGWICWFGRAAGLELDTRGWFRPVVGGMRGPV